MPWVKSRYNRFSTGHCIFQESCNTNTWTRVNPSSGRAISPQNLRQEQIAWLFGDGHVELRRNVSNISPRIRTVTCSMRYRMVEKSFDFMEGNGQGLARECLKNVLPDFLSYSAHFIALKATYIYHSETKNCCMTAPSIYSVLYTDWTIGISLNFTLLIPPDQLLYIKYRNHQMTKWHQSRL